MIYFLTFSWTSRLKHLPLRAFLEHLLPEMPSKVGVLAERSMEKSTKHHTIAPAALGDCGGLGQLWEALAELREAWESSGRSIYRERKTPHPPPQRTLCSYVFETIVKHSCYALAQFSAMLEVANTMQHNFEQPICKNIFCLHSSGPTQMDKKKRALTNYLQFGGGSVAWNKKNEFNIFVFLQLGGLFRVAEHGIHPLITNKKQINC